VRIRGYFAKPKAAREQNTEGNTGLQVFIKTSVYLKLKWIRYEWIYRGINVCIRMLHCMEYFGARSVA
jgi:hypothetical protein